MSIFKNKKNNGQKADNRTLEESNGKHFFIDDENIIWTKVRDIFVEEATGDKGEEDYIQ